MTIRTLLKAAKRFRKAAENLKPGSIRKKAASGHGKTVYDETAAELDVAIADAERDIRDLEKLQSAALRAADLLLSVRNYESRMVGRPWEYSDQAEKLARQLQDSVQAMREPGSLWSERPTPTAPVDETAVEPDGGPRP